MATEGKSYPGPTETLHMTDRRLTRVIDGPDGAPITEAYSVEAPRVRVKHLHDGLYRVEWRPGFSVKTGGAGKVVYKFRREVERASLVRHLERKKRNLERMKGFHRDRALAEIAECEWLLTVLPAGEE